MKTKVISLRINAEVESIIRKQAKEFNRPFSKQLEIMVMAGSKIIESKQPFILAVFPQGANEKEIDHILSSVSSLQIGMAPEK
jgi:hypothetical protein